MNRSQSDRNTEAFEPEDQQENTQKASPGTKRRKGKFDKHVGLNRVYSCPFIK